MRPCQVAAPVQGVQAAGRPPASAPGLAPLPDTLRRLAALPDLDVRAGLVNLADHQGYVPALAEIHSPTAGPRQAEFRSLLAAGDPEGRAAWSIGQGQLRHSAWPACGRN